MIQQLLVFKLGNLSFSIVFTDFICIEFNYLNLDHVTVDEKVDTKIAYDKYVTDKKNCWHYNMSYNMYVESIIDSLIERQQASCSQLSYNEYDVGI